MGFLTRIAEFTTRPALEWRRFNRTGRQHPAEAPRLFLTAIRCGLGRHDPLPDVRWNQGYGFTRCKGCGRDLVRSLLGDWHVPKGHRVVWRVAEPAPPASPLPRVDAPDPNRAVRPVQLTEVKSQRSPFLFDDFDDVDDFADGSAKAHASRSE